MTLSSKKKSEVIDKFKVHQGDTGSAVVQIAILSERIGDLTKHFDKHLKDHSSRRGLLKMVGRRRKLLSYVKNHDAPRYKALISELGIRK